MPSVQSVPKGFHTVTPYLAVKGADSAIGFYKSAFHAEELYRCACSKTKRVLNAKLRIGNSMIMLNDRSAWTTDITVSCTLPDFPVASS